MLIDIMFLKAKLSLGSINLGGKVRASTNSTNLCALLNLSQFSRIPLRVPNSGLDYQMCIQSTKTIIMEFETHLLQRWSKSTPDLWLLPCFFRSYVGISHIRFLTTSFRGSNQLCTGNGLVWKLLRILKLSAILWALDSRLLIDSLISLHVLSFTFLS